MKGSLGFGVLTVLLGGAFQGSIFLPMKFTHRWHWENVWACFSLVAYLLSPWVLSTLLVPHFYQLLFGINPRALMITLLFGAAMGCGALMMGVAYRYAGMAIVFAIVLGISSSVGTLVPLAVLAPEQVFQHQGMVMIGGTAIALLGTAIVGWAAHERDAKKEHAGAKLLASEKDGQRTWLIGMALSIGSGLLSSCGNLGFAFAHQISQKAQSSGAGPTGIASAVWSIILFPVFCCNFGYSLFLLRKNKSLRFFRRPGTAHCWVLSILMGLGWMAGMAAYGAGALLLGKLGTSMGWVLFTSFMIIVANVLGLLTGEWKGARPKALAIMSLGLVVLVSAIVVVGAG